MFFIVEFMHLKFMFEQALEVELKQNNIFEV
jgi:hypothetical protein